MNIFERIGAGVLSRVEKCVGCYKCMRGMASK